MIKPLPTESLRVEKEQMDRVRKFCEKNRYTIGGYVSLVLKKDMDKKEKLNKPSINS